MVKNNTWILWVLGLIAILALVLAIVAINKVTVIGPGTNPDIDLVKCGDPDEFGNCPVGCINYGMPLNCVTQEYYDWCNEGNNCPR